MHAMHSKQPHEVIGIGDHRIGGESLEGAVGGVADEVVDAFPLPQDGVHGLPLADRQIAAVRVDFVSRFAVQPVVGAAQAQALGRDDADVVGGVALAQGAGIEDLHALVGQRPHALVAGLVGGRGGGIEFLHIGGLGEQRDLHFVHDGREIVPQLVQQDRPQVPDAEPGVARFLRNAQPDRVALAQVHHAHRLGKEGVDVPLQNGFELGLHLAAGHFHEDGERQARALRHVADLRPNHANQPVLHLVHGAAGEVLEAPRVLAAELDGDFFLAHALALEGGAVPHRNGDLHGADLDAAHFDRARRHVAVGHVRDHVLVGADAAGQDLRDIGVGDHREAEIDGPGGGGVFLVVHLAQRQHEGEHAALVVEQDLAGFLQPARLEPAEGERGAAGEAEGVNDGRGIRPVGDQERFPVHLHAAAVELRGHGFAARVGPHEDQQVALLQVARQLLGGFVIGQRAHAGGESGHAAIHQLDALLAQDAIGRRAEPIIERQRNAAQRLEGLDGLLRHQGGRAGIQRAPQIGQPKPLGGFGGKPGARGRQRLFQVPESLHPLARQREDDGQGIGGRRKPDVLVPAVAVERLGQRGLRPPHASVAAANGRRCDDLGHQFTPSRYCR